VNKPAGQPILNAPTPVTWLVGLCVGLHLLRFVLPGRIEALLVLEMAFIPARFGVPGLWRTDVLGTVISPIAYTFLHGGWLHLLINMAMLLAFGAAVGRRMSTVRFLLLYFLGGIAGAGATLIFDPGARIPVLGASAAISALVGAVAAMALSPHRAAPRPFHDRRTAWSFILIWVGLNLVFGLIPGEAFGASGRIAWEAHLGGFFAGMILLPLLDPRKKPSPW